MTKGRESFTVLAQDGCEDFTIMPCLHLYIHAK